MRVSHQRFLACAVLTFTGGFVSGGNFWALAFMMLGFGAGWCFHSGWIRLLEEHHMR